VWAGASIWKCWASERAAYGKQIVVTLSRQLAEYGRGYSEKNLRRMVQFAESFPEEEIVAALSRQLSWSHFSALLPLSQPFQREFYAEMARIEGWRVRFCASALTPCYLRWLAQNERERDEDLPLGIILCAGKNSEQIELLELGAAGIHAAEYLTVLPPREVLREKLHTRLRPPERELSPALIHDVKSTGEE
jgi:hypothetical protein